MRSNIIASHPSVEINRRHHSVAKWFYCWWNLTVRTAFFFFKWSPLSNCCPVSDQRVKYMPWIWDALFQVCQVSASTPYRKMLSSHWDQPKCRSSCDTVSRRRGTLFFLQFYFYKLFSRLLMLLFTSPLLPIWTILWNFYCNLFFGEYNETLTQTTNDEIHVK